MTPSEVKRIAIQCGDEWDSTLPTDQEFLERFANAIAAKTREECADLCTDMYPPRTEVGFVDGYEQAVLTCAAAIRSMK